MTIPLPVIPNVFRVAFRWHNASNSQTAVNVMHFLGAGATPLASDLRTALVGNFSASMVIPCANTARVYQLDIIKLDGSAATVSYPVSLPLGASGGDWTPQVSVLVKIQTALRGRNNRGRIYLPMIAESAVAMGVFDPLILPTVQTAWDGFLTAMELATPTAWNPGVASYDRIHSGAGAHFTPITRYVVESFTATQRRRQPGRKVARH